MEQARQTLEAQVLERAAKDPQFRDQLRQDPRGTLAREFGVQVPQGITVEVLEESPSRVYLVLPAVPPPRAQELADSELESVAGGWSEATPCGYSCDVSYCTCGCDTDDCGMGVA